MDSLDRMFRHLARTIRTRFPQYLSQPLDVAELYQTVLPYRLHRRELGLETNEDYEIALTELLSGARDYLIVDERMRDILKTELASPNPDPGAFKQFAGSMVALSPTALRTLEIGPDEDALPSSRVSSSAMTAKVTAERPRINAEPEPRMSGGVSAPQPVAPASASATLGTPSSQPLITPRSVVPQTGERCRTCDQELPIGRPITFCPHCGSNVTTTNCPACGSELEVGWKFCPVCGRPASAGGS